MLFFFFFQSRKGWSSLHCCGRVLDSGHHSTAFILAKFWFIAYLLQIHPFCLALRFWSWDLNTSLPAGAILGFVGCWRYTARHRGQGSLSVVSVFPSIWAVSRVWEVWWYTFSSEFSWHPGRKLFVKQLLQPCGHILGTGSRSLAPCELPHQPGAAVTSSQQGMNLAFSCS